MTENVYKLVMLGVCNWIVAVFKLHVPAETEPRSFLFHAGMWAVLMVYFILYEFFDELSR